MISLQRCAASLVAVLFASGCVVHGSARSSSAHEHHASNSSSKPERKPATPKRVPDADHDAKPPEHKPAEPRPAADPKPKPEAKPPKPEPKPEATPPKPEPKPEPKPTPKPTPETPPVVEPKPPKQPPFKPTPAEKPDKPDKPIKGVVGFVAGKPDGLRAGLPDALWIWKDDHGWKIRTTTDHKVPVRFSGRIWVTEGSLENVGASINELEDRFKRGPREIEFDFATEGRIDGVNFDVKGAKCVHFKLTIDGREQTGLIRLGVNKVTPPRSTFAICL